MSGIEIAGIVLGAFPLLISAIEHRRSIAKAKDWVIDFDLVYHKSLEKIKDIEMLFSLNMEHLLLPLVNEDIIIQSDLERLLANVGGPGWEADDVKNALQARLGKVFFRYMDIMKTMQTTVWKLLDVMGVTKQRFQAKLNKPPATISDRMKLMSLTNKECLEWCKTSKEYYTQKVKHCADGAYREELLTELHESNETVEKFLYRTDRNSKLQVSAVPTRSSEARKALLQYWKHAMSVHTLVQKSWGCTCKQMHCAHLWLQHPTSPTTFELKLLVLSVQNGCLAPGVTTWHQQGLHITWLQRNNTPTFRPQLEQYERLSSPTEPVNMPEQIPLVKRRKRVNFAMLPQKSEPMQANSGSNGEIIDRANPSAGIAATTSSTAQLKECPDEITQLCHAIAECGMESIILGALTDVLQGEQYSVESRPEQKRTTAFGISLAEILCAGEGTTLKARSTRFQIALAVASAHLQLQSTPWARRQWEAKDILFPQDSPDKVLVDFPYVSADFKDLSEEDEQPRQSSHSFACLGIMLLELLFGKPLEACDVWQAEGIEPHGASPRKRAMVASVWAEDVESEAGFEYAAAVKWCIRESPPVLDGTAWRKDLADNVVAAIEQSCGWIKPVAMP